MSIFYAWPIPPKLITADQLCLRDLLSSVTIRQQNSSTINKVEYQNGFIYLL